jgi:hypothetical protein
MIPNNGFKKSDVAQQTLESASSYLCQSLRLLAERFGLEKSLTNDPAAFAVQFAPLVSALIEAQAREYQSMVLNSIDGSLLSGLADIAGQMEDRNAATCRSCARKAGAAHWQAWREEREACSDGEGVQA